MLVGLVTQYLIERCLIVVFSLAFLFQIFFHLYIFLELSQKLSACFFCNCERIREREEVSYLSSMEVTELADEDFLEYVGIAGDEDGHRSLVVPAIVTRMI